MPSHSVYVLSCLVLSLSALVFSRAGYASWGLSFSSVWYYLHLVFSACMAAVKSRPVPHHCEVIFFWSLGITKCTCMVFTFENGVPLMRKGASVVWHHSLLLMNSFNKTEAAVFFVQVMLPEGIPFHQFIISTNRHLEQYRKRYITCLKYYNYETGRRL